jgi:hypothetical protein
MIAPMSGAPIGLSKSNRHIADRMTCDLGRMPPD